MCKWAQREPTYKACTFRQFWRTGPISQSITFPFILFFSSNQTKHQKQEKDKSLRLRWDLNINFAREASSRHVVIIVPVAYNNRATISNPNSRQELGF